MAKNLFLFSGLVVFLGLVVPGLRADEKDDEKLLAKVMNLLLATEQVGDDYPKKYFWPPKYYIKPDSTREMNAYATASKNFGATVEEKSGKVRPVVMITQGFMKNLIKGDENLLAVIMGHELAHVMKDHVGSRPGETELFLLAFNREQEIEADLQGMKYLVAAGFPYKSAVASAVREMKSATRHSSFEGLSATHPTWEERLALLDRDQAQIWKAMSSYRNGLLFLEVEQYLAAQQCFRAVTKEFPDCHEAWANLGYAQLMQYCDGLDADDLRRFDIGMMVTGAFYFRPHSLESKVRGIDEKLWQDAVKALNKALAVKADLALPRANLGLAYLVHPEGKDVKQAQKWFQEALEHYQKDPELSKNPIALGAVLVNAAVADLARGQKEEAARKFKVGEKLAKVLDETSFGDSLHEALLYNQALVATHSTDTKQAYQLLETYLRQANPDSAWWTLAQERYHKLAKALDVTPRSPEELGTRSQQAKLRLLTSVKVGSRVLTLSESLQEAVDHLGEKDGVALPLYPGSKMVRWRFAKQGIDLLGKEKILAVFLTNAQAPPLVLQAMGVAGKARELRVGMTTKETQTTLQGQLMDSNPRYLADPDLAYSFYPELGLAIRFGNGQVQELALIQIPRRTIFEK
jgi:tetratricopeptide (TPR) repeat protein